MSRTAQDHLRFSFGVKNNQLISARSTPKFPSIEIDKDSIQSFSSFKHKSQYSTKQVRAHQISNQINRQFGGEDIDRMQGARVINNNNTKIHPFLFQDSNTLEDQSSRSIKSTQSAKAKYFLNTHHNSRHPRQKIIIGNHFAAGNMFALRREGSFCQRMQFQIQRNKLKANSVGKLHNLVIRESLECVEKKPNRKQTKKINKSLFDLSPKNVQFRQTKKKVIETSGLILSSRDKMKPFKSMFQKARPTLRFENRQLNNQKIKQMSQLFSSYQQQRENDVA